MIIGHGDIASVLKDREGFIFFASGVSNSQCTDEAEYDREIALLREQNPSQHLVYFSSLAIFYSDTRYVQHKRLMEDMVKARFPRHTIIRLGNISWGNNPHTLINYLKAHPEAEIQDTYRYVVDLEEFTHWIEMIPVWNCEMNVVGARLKVKEIQEKYVK